MNHHIIKCYLLDIKDVHVYNIIAMIVIKINVVIDSLIRWASQVGEVEIRHSCRD